MLNDNKTKLHEIVKLMNNSAIEQFSRILLYGQHKMYEHNNNILTLNYHLYDYTISRIQQQITLERC